MDLMTIFVLDVIILMVLLFLGTPLPYCFAGALLFILTAADVPITSLMIWGYSQMVSPVLLAIPMFILAGSLIGESGIASKLLKVADIFVGKIKGALGVICVITCGFLGAISGSAFTGIAAVGPIMIPEMRKEGYSNGFATALVSASSILGVLIPPSIPLIVYGWATGASILGSFLATVVPGVLTIITFSIINVVYARKYANSPISEELLQEWKQEKARKPETKSGIFFSAIPALLMPVIILGGIYGGFFTPSEAASVAATVALFIGVIIYRQLKYKNTRDMLFNTASSIGSIFTMIFFCLLLSQTFVNLKIPQQLVEIFMSTTDNKYVVLIIVNVFLLFVGMIVNDTTAVVLCAPLLLPVVASYGVSPVHFAAILVVNLAAGGLTPPYASILYFGMRVGKCKFGEIFKPVMLLLLVGYLPVIILTTYFEPVAMFLPRLLGYS